MASRSSDSSTGTMIITAPYHYTSSAATSCSWPISAPATSLLTSIRLLRRRGARGLSPPQRHRFFPLSVFCGDELLVAYLRPSDIDAWKHARAVLKLLVRR